VRIFFKHNDEGVTFLAELGNIRISCKNTSLHLKAGVGAGVKKCSHKLLAEQKVECSNVQLSSQYM